jgi:hypothetical protein
MRATTLPSIWQLAASNWTPSRSNRAESLEKVLQQFTGNPDCADSMFTTQI